MVESSTLHQSTLRLPLAWVAKIFQRMHGTYGARFLNTWKTGQIIRDGEEERDAGVQNAMETWAVDLAGFADTPWRISWALENLPADSVLSSKAFADLCRRAPGPVRPALPHKLTPAEREHQRELARAASDAAKKKCGYDNLAWARRPASQAAAAKLHEAWKQPFKYPELAKIFDGLLAQGVVDQSGKLLVAAA